VLPESEGAPLRCWLADGNVVTFPHGEYTIITPDASAGFWVIGQKNGAEFQGMVPYTSIARISVHRLSLDMTALLGYIGLTTVLSALAAAAGAGGMGGI
jgi:hypothetical protein